MEEQHAVGLLLDRGGATTFPASTDGAKTRKLEPSALKVRQQRDVKRTVHTQSNDGYRCDLHTAARKSSILRAVNRNRRPKLHDPQERTPRNTCRDRRRTGPQREEMAEP